MDIQFYKNFIAIVESGSFLQASEKLNIATSALITQVKQLEQITEQKLLERHPGRRLLEITDAGKIFLEDAKYIVSVHENIMQDMLSFKKGKSGTLHISASAARSQVLVQNYLAPFHRKYPDINFDIIETNLPQIEKNIIDGVSEIAVSNSPLTLPLNLEILDTKKENYYAVFLTEKEYYNKDKKSLALEDLMGKPLCVSAGNSNLFLNVMTQSGLHPHILSHHSLRNMSINWALTGECIAVLPMDENERRLKELRYLPIDDERLYTEKIVFKLKGKKLSTIAKLFLDFYMEQSGK